MNPFTVRALAHLQQFLDERDADRLEAVADDLQRVVLNAETDPGRRRELRGETLELWLKLFAAIDANLDPKFDPDDSPMVSAMPPRVGDVQYPPGVDPSVIADPVAREEYEHRIAANRQKARDRSLQFKLRRLDESLQPHLENFVHEAYTTTEADTHELDAAIRSHVPNQHRADRLRRSLAVRKGAE